MPEVSGLGIRRSAQDRVTNNRDVVIPTRRLVDAPRIQNQESVRNAARGDGGAEELRKTLGLVTSAVGDLADLGTKKAAVTAAKDAGQARADEALGTVDEAKRKTSTAYGVAISMSRARKKASEIELILRPEIEDLLSKGADADPTKGELPVDLEDVNNLIEARFKSLVLGPDGKPIDFGDPAANMEVYSKLEEMRPKFLNGAQEIIRAQEAEKVIRGFGDELELEITKSGTVDVEAYMGRLPPGVDRNKARASLLAAVINGAEQSEDPEAILKVANSRRADGTPTWTPQQEGQLRDQARSLASTLEVKHDKEAKAKSLETLGSLSVSVRMGRKLDPAQVSAMVASGQLRPEDAENAFAIQERMDDDKWEAVTRARADVNWAESRVDRSYTLAQRREASTGAQANTTFLRAAMISGELSEGQAQREAGKLFSAGSISLKTYDMLVDEAKKLKTNDVAVKDANAAGYETNLKRIGSRALSQASEGKPGRADVATVNLRNATAQHAFYRALRQGREPTEAYALALATYPGATPAQVGAATTQAAATEGRRTTSK